MNESLQEFADVIRPLQNLRKNRAPEALRQRMTSLEQGLSAHPTPAFPVFRRAFAYTFAAVVLLVAGTSTAAYAIGNSRPGTMLYAVKRATEDTVSSLPLGKYATFLNLKFAGDRAEDIGKAAGASDSAAIKQATDDYQMHVEKAVQGSVGSKDEDSFKENMKKDLEVQHQTLEEAHDAAPDDAKDDVGKAQDAAENGLRQLNGTPTVAPSVQGASTQQSAQGAPESTEHKNEHSDNPRPDKGNEPTGNGSEDN